MPDTRLQQLTQWVRTQVSSDVPALTVVSGDASFRRYYRVQTLPTLIAVDAPPEQEPIQPFLDVTTLFQGASVLVPDVKAFCLEHGFMLLGDLGDDVLLNILNRENAKAYYQKALLDLLKVQHHFNDKSEILPSYTKAKLRQEMMLFQNWLLERHLGIVLNENDLAILHDWFEVLEEAVLSQPEVLVHRDYHSRNLMVQSDQGLGIIDYQDAVFGPITYDVVSLLKDCYIKWPREFQLQILRFYWTAAQRDRLFSSDFETLVRYFDWMGIQRHLKASGIFSRLFHRDGKPNYMNDIPRTMSYIVEMLALYPEFETVHHWFQQKLRATFSEANLNWTVE